MNPNGLFPLSFYTDLPVLGLGMAQRNWTQLTYGKTTKWFEEQLLPGRGGFEPFFAAIVIEEAIIMEAKNFLVGLGLGASGVYFLEEKGGRQRRALLKDKAVHGAHAIAGAMGTTGQDIWNRTRGLVSNAVSFFGPHEVEGQVVLEGPILQSEAAALLKAVKSIFENFPKFMRNVRDVKPTGVENEWHWTVRGPAGLSVGWNAVVTQQEPNKVLAWKT